jgi:hypothetical protein
MASAAASGYITSEDDEPRLGDGRESSSSGDDSSDGCDVFDCDVCLLPKRKYPRGLRKIAVHSIVDTDPETRKLDKLLEQRERERIDTLAEPLSLPVSREPATGVRVDARAVREELCFLLDAGGWEGDKILDVVAEDFGTTIGGSAFLWALISHLTGRREPWMPADVDIWVRMREAPEGEEPEPLEYFERFIDDDRVRMPDVGEFEGDHSSVGEEKSFHSPAPNTAGPNLQIITHQNGPSPSLHFDLDLVRGEWHSDSEVFVSAAMMECIESRRVHCTAFPDQMVSFSDSSEWLCESVTQFLYRLQKYEDRGFAVASWPSRAVWCGREWDGMQWLSEGLAVAERQKVPRYAIRPRLWRGGGCIEWILQTGRATKAARP